MPTDPKFIPEMRRIVNRPKLYDQRCYELAEKLLGAEYSDEERAELAANFQDIFENFCAEHEK